MMKDLVFIGGGHSHAIALRLWALNPLPGVRITLISEASDTPYSGMLPGHVAGFYQRQECYIDLDVLTQFAQAQFYVDRVIGLDLEKNQVICQNHLPIKFDLLSIDIGSTPYIPQIKDSDLCPYSIAAKPIKNLLESWDNLLTNIRINPPKSLKISLVGGGVSGVELSIAIQQRLKRELKDHNTNLIINLIHQETELLANHNRWVRQRVHQVLKSRQIYLHLSETAQGIIPNFTTNKANCILQCESGLKIPSDYIFWVTQARAPHWLKSTGLTLDDRGFILVKDTLQSVSHPHIFAAGDIATMINHPRPKAGVFAVRQGPPLCHNLQNVILGKTLKNYCPQTKYLNLIGTADGKAIASRGNWGWHSFLLWQLKDYIDRKFMRQFRNLIN